MLSAKCAFVFCSILYLLLCLRIDVNAVELPETDCLHEIAINVGVATVNSTMVHNTSCINAAIATPKPTVTTATTTTTPTTTTTVPTTTTYTTVPTTTTYTTPTTTTPTNTTITTPTTTTKTPAATTMTTNRTYITPTTTTITPTNTTTTPTNTTTTPTTTTKTTAATTTTDSVDSYLTANCGNNFTLLGDHCYYFSNYELSWDDSLKACRDLGTDLAHPIDFGQFSLIKGHLEKLRKINHYGYPSWWLGGTDAVEEGKWVWSHDGSPIFYSEWTGNHPDDDRNGDCLLITAGTRIYNWYDFKCYTLSRFICQYPRVKTHVLKPKK